MTGAGSRRYLLCAALLAAHEVDAGYWREWSLFGLPGGAALFVALHVPIFLLLVWGYGEVLLGTRAGRTMALVLSLAALAGFVLHAVLIRTGHDEFRSLTSLAILAGVAVSGAVLLPAGLRPRRRRRGTTLRMT